MQRVMAVQALQGAGLAGDHKSAKRNASGRQVTLINHEDMQAVQSLMGMAHIDPQQLRRNIVISGVNLYAMRYQRLQVGEAVLEIRAHCHPCARMEQTLGDGAVLALYGHAGFCAVVEQGGLIRAGDPVTRLEPPAAMR